VLASGAFVSTQEFTVPSSIRVLLGATLALSISLGAQAEEEEAPKVVAADKQVSIEYTLKLDDGTVADTNVGAEPLVYTQGASQILPGLENELLGLKVWDTKQVALTAANGYGEIDADLFQTVPASQIPEDARKAGTQLMAQSQEGQARPVRVHEVKGEEGVMDFNHPLAGKALNFDVKILAVD
jgi:FKBP-type peptidyl-prolyl cis-trans isomerase SlyD